ncbi:MAG: hypothetical protein A2176_07595 [Spirochaetes bacterium RBG_13_51_14]|nr:MAG: hypothetical protein A2176_07595 [Spirochaetes bacterium RBG_13_51_14]
MYDAKRNMLAGMLIMHLTAGILIPGLSAGLIAAAEGVRIPENPPEPTVNIKNALDRGEQTDIPATVITATGERLSGSLLVPFNSLEIEFNEDGKSRIRNVELSGIESIEFTRWRGIERRKNEFAFYPVRARITLSDKKIIECGRNIPQLNKMFFHDSRVTSSIYSYFYDYRKDNVWLTSGHTEIDYPETNPNGNTVVRIIFNRIENANPFEWLFFRK